MKGKKLTGKITACCLMGLILLASSGCREAHVSGGGLLTEEELASREELYGSGRDDVFQALGITEDEITESSSPGAWDLREPADMEGTAFTSSLLFDVSNETLYGFRYMYQSGSSEGTAELMDTLLSKATELYGAPDTYPGLSNRLSSEDFQTALSSGTMGEWYEEWEAGSESMFTLSVHIIDAQTSTLILDYSLKRPL